MAQQIFVRLSTSTSFTFSSTTLQFTLDDVIQIYSSVIQPQYMYSSIRDQACLLINSFRPYLCLATGFTLPSTWNSSPSCQICCDSSPLFRNTCIFRVANFSLSSCHQLIDHFGDHLNGCIHSPCNLISQCSITLVIILSQKTTLRFIGNKEYLVSLPVALVMYFIYAQITESSHKLILWKLLRVA